MRSTRLTTALIGSFALIISCSDSSGPGDGGGGGGGGPTPTTIVSSADNTLYETVPKPPPTDTVFTNGGGTQMFAGKTAGGAGNASDIPRIRRALVKFDVAGAIPAGATIDSVCLELVAVKGKNGTARMVSIHRVTMDWGEGTVIGICAGGEGGGCPPDTGDVTWDHTFYPNSTWNTRGGDFVATASATTTVGSVNGTKYKWGPTAAMTADVQAWLDSPSTNFGYVLIGAEAPTDSLTVKGFGTREQPATRQPKLKVYFTEP